MEKKSEVAWLARIWRWIRRRLTTKNNAPKSPKILKRWYYAECAVLKIERKTQGALATYRIVSLHRGDHWLIAWDDLKRRDTELLGEFDGTAILLRANNNFLWHTHGFSVWRTKEGSTVPRLVGAWNVRLIVPPERQRFRAKFGLKSVPYAIAEDVARHLGEISQGKVESWQEQVERINWVGLVQFYACIYMDDSYEIRAVSVEL